MKTLFGPCDVYDKVRAIDKIPPDNQGIKLAPALTGLLAWTMSGQSPEWERGKGPPYSAVEIRAIQAVCIEKIGELRWKVAAGLIVDSLSVNGKGGFTGRSFFRRCILGRTPPVREVARKVLVEWYGVDHEYDIERWRKAIDLANASRPRGAAPLN